MNVLLRGQNTFQTWNSLITRRNILLLTVHHSLSSMGKIQILLSLSHPLLALKKLKLKHQLHSNLCMLHGLMPKTACLLLKLNKLSFPMSTGLLEFTPGDLVLLKRTPMKKNPKLGPAWIGPFQIETKNSAVTCRLKLPPGTRMHPVVYVGYLRPYKSSAALQAAPDFKEDPSEYAKYAEFQEPSSRRSVPCSLGKCS